MGSKNSTVYRQDSGRILKTIGLAHRNMKIGVQRIVLEKNKFISFPILFIPDVGSNSDLPATLISGFLISWDQIQLKSSSRISFSQNRKRKHPQGHKQNRSFSLSHKCKQSRNQSSQDFRIPSVTSAFYFNALPSLRLGFYFMVQKWVLELHPSHPYPSQLEGRRGKRISYLRYSPEFAHTLPPLTH